MTLSTNRYGQTTPNLLLSNGITIATPVYFNLPTDTAKGILNAFREVKLRQLVEMGWTDTRASIGGLSVTTAEQPPQTQVELELGMNEEALRYALFTRAGVQERLVLKLQKILDLDLIKRTEIEKCYDLWLNEFEFNTAAKAKPAARKTPTRRKVATTSTKS